jgi:HEAT repeat protein
MATVFICYDRQDSWFADVVQSKLEKNGHTTLMDLEILRAGDHWQEELDKAIRSSQVVVVIMTPNARASEQVSYEWAFALGADKRVIPIELEATEFPTRLEDLHRLPFVNKTYDWLSLLDQLKKAEASNPISTILIEAGMSPAVKQAVRGIDSTDPNERLAAVRTLAQTDEASAHEALVQALKHPMRDVRAAAACHFPDRKDPRIVPGLVEWYRDEWQRWRKGGFRGDRPSFSGEIVAIGSPAIPALLSTLNEGSGTPVDRALRYEILNVFAQVGDASVTPVLLKALEDADAEIRKAAAKALGPLRDPSVVPSLRLALSDENSYVRCAVVASLGLLKDAPSLRSALSDDDASVREESVASLGVLKDTEAVPELLRLLGEDTGRVRAAAAKALGIIGDQSAVPALSDALQDEEHAVRVATAEALGLLDDARAIPHLRSLLMEESTMIGDPDIALMVALIRLKDTESFPAIEKRLINFRSGTGPFRVCQALAHFGDTGVQSLIRILNSTDSSSVAEYAARELSSLRAPEASAALKAWRRKQH